MVDLVVLKTYLKDKRQATQNPFHATSLFLYPLILSDNLRFSDVFKRYREMSIMKIMKWLKRKGEGICANNLFPLNLAPGVINFLVLISF